MADRLQKIDLDLQWRIGKLTQDLCFRFDLGGHQVQDEHAQRANILMDSAMLGHHEDILTFKHACCRQRIRNLIGIANVLSSVFIITAFERAFLLAARIMKRKAIGCS